jgi:uncharacterized protein
MATPNISKTWLREGPVELPLADVRGGADGPTIAVMAGMHGGEYAGVLALTRVIQDLAAAEVSGRVLIIPIISVPSFFGRSMQLFPGDERELHEIWPGNRDSASSHLIDLVFRTVRDSDAVVDMHAGELVQDLTPFVGIPWREDGPLFARSAELASAFDVPFTCKRAMTDVVLGLPTALLDAGVPNIWTEIGHNGLPEAATERLQYEGVMNLLRLEGVLPGGGVRHAPRLLGPRHFDVFADRSGVWRPAVRAGQRVATGDVMGEIHDVFGDGRATYTSPGDGIVEYVCTSPAINVDRAPHGYRWHYHLAKLVEMPAGDPDL